MSTTKPPVAPASAPSAGNPAEFAREAFRRLATRRIAPTPQNYTVIYNEVAGIVEPAPVVQPAPAPTAEPEDGAAQMLSDFAVKLHDTPGELHEFGRRLQRVAKVRDWDTYGRTMGQLVEKHFRNSNLIDLAPPGDNPESRQLRDMLSRTLCFAVAALAEGSPAIVAEAEALGTAVKQASTEETLADIGPRLKQMCYQIEIKRGDVTEQQDLLLRLFKLLLENVSELLDDDSWIRGQVDAVQRIIAGPVDPRQLEEATRSLKEVIYKQGQLKHSLSDVKITVNNMMRTFIDRLGSVASSTDDFQQKMGGFSERISCADDIADVNQVLDEVLVETRRLQSETLAARDRMIAAQQEAEDAEQRIVELETKLREMSELAREDQLTGSLNRRGLDDIFSREAARADRRNTPLCVALLDLDDFKRLNDTFGHQAGDGALRHLVRIVKATLRSIDAIARMGGEEFLIVMPETTANDAAAAMVRLQRELTRHFFMHENEKMLITFSAGVALRQQDEHQEALVRRADKAMYEAKQTGKNRVVIAD